MTYEQAEAKLRTFISDNPQLNVLDKDYECTYDELVDYIKDALIEINMDFAPTTVWTMERVVQEPGEDGDISWSIVKLGAVLQYLTAKGILSARNTLTFSDAGGAQVSDMDRWGRYINYYNVLISKYTNGVQVAKRSWNVQQMGWSSGVRSPLDTYTW